MNLLLLIHFGTYYLIDSRFGKSSVRDASTMGLHSFGSIGVTQQTSIVLIVKL